MQLSEMHPFVRYARRVTPWAVAPFSMPLAAHDHRLFCCVGGEGSIYAAGAQYSLSAGRMLYIRAGEAYRYVDLQESFELFAFNFDFDMTRADRAHLFPPVAATEYRPADMPAAQVPEHPVFRAVSAVSLPEMIDSVVRMEEEYRHGRMLYEERLSHLLADLLLAFVRAAVREETPRTAVTVRSITAYIREHYMEPLDNARIAAVFRYHPNYINRLMVEHTGLSLHAYLNRYRMDRAMSLLSSTTLTVSEVAARVGFSELSHFSKTFRRFTGYAPVAFRCKL